MVTGAWRGFAPPSSRPRKVSPGVVPTPGAPLCGPVNDIYVK